MLLSWLGAAPVSWDLGMAIVRHLVELHGGSVSAASAGEGRGATFTVRFPIRAIQGDADELGPTLFPPPSPKTVNDSGPVAPLCCSV